MAENLSAALLIMAIGMAVVFAAIILLWGMMAALVRLTADPVTVAPQIEPAGASTDPGQLRRQAAAVAVAVARQQAARSIETQSIPAAAAVSPWQAVMRGRQFRQRGPIR
jgi:Na+-transporting methylmalonyl-CoA/oxaloacetate decarboxylase gamma subunit